MPLRPYQIEALEAIRSARNRGIMRPLVVISTGGGKSELFGSLPSGLPVPRGTQMWVMTHLEELVLQTHKRLQGLNPDLKVGIEKAEYHADRDCDIVIGSVPTLSMLKPGRMKDIDAGRVSVVVADECHHFISPSFIKVLRHFRVLRGDDNEDRSKLLLGVTATPQRGDNQGLENIFDEIVYSKDLRELIKEGWLCNLKAHSISTYVDLSGVAVRHGDFVTRQLEQAVNTESRNKIIVQKYLELGGGKQGIAFTVDIKHSHDLAMEFRKAGVNAMPLSGKTPKEERNRLLEGYRNGSIQVLCSCNVLSEGVDLPMATVGMLCRPTKSGLLLRQQIGRMARLYPSPELGTPIKTEAILLDFMDNCSRHPLCTVPSLFGIPHKTKMAGEDVIQAAEEVEQIREAIRRPLPDEVNMAELRALVSSMDLLKPPSIPPELESMSDLLWIKEDSSYELLLPDCILSVAQDALGKWRSFRRSKGVISTQVQHSDLSKAIAFCDGQVLPHERVLVSKKVKWRSLPVTEKQAIVLRRIRRDLAKNFPDLASFYKFIRENYTRGEVSSMIDVHKKGVTK